MSEKRKPRAASEESGNEFFYKDSEGKHCDAALHEGNEEGEQAVGEQAKRAAKARGLSDEEVERFYGDGK